MIAHTENNYSERDEYLDKLTSSPSQRAKIVFFEDSGQSEQVISRALLNCTELPTEVRGINAFIHVYSDQIRETMSQQRMDNFYD